MISFSTLLKVAIVALFIQIPTWLDQRDTKVLLKYPKPPVPEYKKMSLYTWKLPRNMDPCYTKQNHSEGPNGTFYKQEEPNWNNCINCFKFNA